MDFIEDFVLFRLHLVGVKNLIVEVDAKYIKGMLNAPIYSQMQP